MRALVLAAYNRLELVDVPLPAVGPRDVLVRVRACGICGSDVHGLDGSTGRRIPPIVMGHEAAGEVAGVGPEVDGWRPGDRVTFDSTISCGGCGMCRSGQVNLCDRRRVLGVSCEEYRQPGAFAEYLAIPQHGVYRLPDGVSFVEGALVEPLSIALHAVSRAAVAADSRVVVVGTGVIGCLIVGVLRARGVRTIVAVDRSPARLALAARLGAAATILADVTNADVAAAVRAATAPDGADVVFEAVGIDPTVALAIGSARKGGTVVLVGNAAPVVGLPLQAVVTRQLSVLGSAASSGEYPECLELIASGRIDATALVGAVRPLGEGAAWFERLRRGQDGLVKVILEP